MTFRGSPDWLAAYNAKRGGYAPATVGESNNPDYPVGSTLTVAGLRDPTLIAQAFACTIPGVPVAKGRPRFDKTGHAHTPEKTRAAEATVASVVSLFEPPHFAGPVRIELDFFFPTPARMARERVRQALGGTIRPTAPPDTDNLGKLVLDAIQGHGPGTVITDDSQVVELVLRKWYSVEPRTMLRVTAL